MSLRGGERGTVLRPGNGVPRQRSAEEHNARRPPRRRAATPATPPRRADRPTTAPLRAAPRRTAQAARPARPATFPSSPRPAASRPPATAPPTPPRGRRDEHSEHRAAYDRRRRQARPRHECPADRHRPGAAGVLQPAPARHLAEVDAACSRFRTDSELAALNTAAGRPVRVSPLFAETLAVALRASEATDGAVDWTSCGGHGLCAEVLPDHIAPDEWGYPLLDGTPVPAHTVRRARRAAACCPVLAMKPTAR